MAAPSKPTELKRRLGNPGKRPLPQGLTVIAHADLTTQPPHLAEAGAETWRMIATHATWIAPSDLASVVALCDAMDRRAELVANLAEHGYVLYTDKGYAYQNPAFGALSTTEDQIRKWLSLLGLTPSDRGRLGVAEVKAMSQLERLVAGRSARTRTAS